MRMLKQGIIVAILVGLQFINAENSGDKGPKVTFSGSNHFETRYGKKARLRSEQMDFFWDKDYRIQPWYYLKDFLDFNIGIQKFFVKGRFQVDEPSMGLHPENVSWYREFIPQRTFGFNGDVLTLETGTFQTVFGRGLTINLKDDPTVELSNLLDGVQMTFDLPWATIKGFAGREPNEKYLGIINNKNDTITIEKVGHYEEFIEADIMNLIEDYQARDNVYGLHLESFPFSYIPFLSFLSASSLGAGILNYRSDVESETFYFADTTFHQERTNILVPSWLANLSLGEVSVYGEYARTYATSHVYDTANNRDSINTKTGFATFLELSGGIGDFYLRGEYINYFYQYAKGEGLTNDNSARLLKRYSEPPWARFKQLWHLLSKHTFIPKVENVLGYNTEVTWTPNDNTQMLLTFSMGGQHKELENDSTKYSFFKFTEKERYYEVYAEWNQKIRDIMNIKVGLDYGQLDPLDTTVITGAFCTKVDFGPFQEKHSFGIGLEMVMNNTKFRAEKDYKKVRALTMEWVDSSEIHPDHLASPYDSVFRVYYNTPDIPVNAKSTHLEPTFNFLVELDYTFSSLFKLNGIFEQEMRVGGEGIVNDGIVLFDDILSNTRYFLNGGLTFSPGSRHTFILEAGSFSKKKICNMGICTILPAFKGVRFTIKSIL